MGWYTDTRLGIGTARLVGPRIALCAKGLLYFASHHPKERHWYLQMLGTEPDAQSKGLGSAILAPVLERCDREGERVYLESSKERNIPFYARHGFAVTEEIQVPAWPGRCGPCGATRARCATDVGGPRRGPGGPWAGGVLRTTADRRADHLGTGPAPVQTGDGTGG